MSRMGGRDVGRGEGSLLHSCRRMAGEAIEVRQGRVIFALILFLQAGSLR